MGESRSRVGHSIKGSISMSPRITYEVLRWENAWRDHSAALCVAELDSIAGFLAAPSSKRLKGSNLALDVRDGWPDEVPSALDQRLLRPIILSARTNWTIEDQRLKVFGTAYILEGSEVIRSQLLSNAKSKMPFLVLLGLDEPGELSLRRELINMIDVPKPLVNLQKVDSDTPRLVINTNWSEFLIDSEPFVVPTARGYAPAILVKRRSVPYREHVLLGAKSLSAPLEKLRKSHGQLGGLTIRIRKSSELATATYEFEVR